MAKSQIKFNAEVVDRIVDAVRIGNYVATASAAAGIHRATYYSWMKRGEQASDARATGEPLDDDDEGSLTSTIAFRELPRKRRWMPSLTFVRGSR